MLHDSDGNRLQYYEPYSECVRRILASKNLSQLLLSRTLATAATFSEFLRFFFPATPNRISFPFWAEPSPSQFYDKLRQSDVTTRDYVRSSMRCLARLQAVGGSRSAS
jgi:hypothetical protein